MASSITPEVGAELLKAVHTESPRPSERNLAKRFGITSSSVHRYLVAHELTAEQTKQLTSNSVKAELVAATLPAAVAEVKELTKNLPISKLCKVMESAEAQYNKHKDTDPQLAGGYLDQMRKCAVEMAKWLGLDKGLSVQDNAITITVRHEVPPRGER